jgi:hypothetical protein
LKINLLALAMAAALLSGCPHEEPVKTEYVPVDRNVTINNQPPAAPATTTVIHDQTIVHDAPPAPAAPPANNVTINNPPPAARPTATIVHDTAPPTHVTIQNQIVMPNPTPSPSPSPSP